MDPVWLLGWGAFVDEDDFGVADALEEAAEVGDEL